MTKDKDEHPSELTKFKLEFMENIDFLYPKINEITEYLRAMDDARKEYFITSLISKLRELRVFPY